MTVLVTLAASMLHAILAAWLYQRIDGTAYVLVPLVAALVGAPICAWSLQLIRRLRASRRAVKQMAERLAVAVSHAEAASQAKSEFLAHMSHELRTPLNAIIGFSEIMDNQLLGPVGNRRYLDYVKDIHESGTHLLNVINDILDLSKIESGNSTLDNAIECRAADLIDSATRMVRPMAARRQVEIRNLAAEQETRLLVAERMARQVILNILSNAVKFTPPAGSVTVRCDRNRNGDCLISVSDTGVGMSAEEVRVALTPFGQINSRIARENKGAGLGLPLARAMMELHGGGLSVHSMPRRGTTVDLTFPADRVIAAAA